MLRIEKYNVVREKKKEMRATVLGQSVEGDAVAAAATGRVPRWRIRERPLDMVSSCE